MTSTNIYILRSRISEILRTFRDLVVISELKIDKVNTSNDEITVEGKYRSKALFTGEIIEEGTFKITFDKQLNPKSISITPSHKG
mgnify:CR=1 FL=1